MRNDPEEKLVFEQIKKMEEALHARLDLAKKQAATVIARAQEKADSMIREKESRLAELQHSMESEAADFPEQAMLPENAETPPSSDLVKELADELFERVAGQPGKAI